MTATRQFESPDRMRVIGKSKTTSQFRGPTRRWPANWRRALRCVRPIDRHPQAFSLGIVTKFTGGKTMKVDCKNIVRTFLCTGLLLGVGVLTHAQEPNNQAPPASD